MPNGRMQHAVFQPTGEESGGHWDFKKKVDEKWEMRYILLPRTDKHSASVARQVLKQ